jgi:hypothetical protein
VRRKKRGVEIPEDGDRRDACPADRFHFAVDKNQQVTD